MSTHAINSPSAFHRRMACPGSKREEAKYPDAPSGPAAVDGTHTHTVLEYCLTHDYVELHDLIGIRLSDHEGEFQIDKERLDRVKVALDYVDQRQKELGFCQIISERRISPAHFLGRDDMDGTADIQLHSPKCLEIIDYKDGIHPVDPSAPQLRIYALAALAQLKLAINATYPYEVVRLTIVQPKLALKGGKPISWVEYTVEEVIGWIGEFVRAAAATDDPDAPLVPGQSHCRYCKAKGCTARFNAGMEAAGIKFDNLDVAKEAANKNPNELPDDKLRELVESAPLIRQMLNAAEEEALRRIQGGHNVAGLKLVYGRGTSSWAYDEQEMAKKLTTMGVPKSALYVTKLVSPAQAKKLSWEKRDGTAVKLTDRQIKTLETEYISKSQGKLTVVPESDNREAVTFGAANLFAAVETPDQGATLALPDWLK